MKPTAWKRNREYADKKCPICGKSFISNRVVIGENLPAVGSDGELWTRYVPLTNEYLHIDGKYCVHQQHEYKPVNRKFVLREGTDLSDDG